MTVTKLTVLVWDPVKRDYTPAAAKAGTVAKEFRGPVDPATVAGVVLHKYDTWMRA